MDNQLIDTKTMSDEQIMKAIGQDSGGGEGNNIPRLAINRNPEDDDGNALPVGNFYTYDASVGTNVFGKPVTFRPFISAMQYMHYEPEKGEYVNRSIIFKSWKEEAIDIQGGTRCNKVPYKDRDSLSPEDLAEQRKIRCYRLLYGLVSFDSKTSDGTDHKVKNLPTLWRVTGTSFAPVGAAIEQINKRKKLMFSCTFTLDSKRQKKGGNTFYVPEIKVNADANLKMSAEDMDNLKAFQETINYENNEIANLYQQAKSKKSNGSDTVSAKIMDDMDDELPDPAQVFAK